MVMYTAPLRKNGYAEILVAHEIRRCEHTWKNFCSPCEGGKGFFREIPIPITDIGNLLSI
jgi:hypothetical protein